MGKKKKAAKKVAKKKVYHRIAAPVAKPEPVVEAPPSPESEVESPPESKPQPEPKLTGTYFGPEDLTKPAWPAGAPNREDVAVAYKNDWGDWVFKMKGTNRKIIIKES